MFLINNWDWIKRHLDVKNVSYCSIPEKSVQQILWLFCLVFVSAENVFLIFPLPICFYFSIHRLVIQRINLTSKNKVSLSLKDIRWNHLGKQLSNMKYNDYCFSRNLILGRKLFRFKSMRSGFEIETVLEFKVISICNNS